MKALIAAALIAATTCSPAAVAEPAEPCQVTRAETVQVGAETCLDVDFARGDRQRFCASIPVEDEGRSCSVALAQIFEHQGRLCLALILSDGGKQVLCASQVKA